MGGGGACGPCHWGLRCSSLWGHETCDGACRKKGADACGPCHWGLRCSSLWGHETNEWRAETKGADACGPCQWGLRWGSLRGNETCEGRARTMGADAYGHCHQGLRPSVELRRARVARISPPSPVGPLSDGPRASPNCFQMQFPCTFIFCPTCFWNYDPFYVFLISANFLNFPSGEHKIVPVNIKSSW